MPNELDLSRRPPSGSRAVQMREPLPPAGGFAGSVELHTYGSLAPIRNGEVSA